MTTDRFQARSAKPAVTFISQWYAPEFGDGGIPRGIATALANGGHHVDVLTGFPNYPLGRLFPGYRQSIYQLETIDAINVHRSPLYVSHDTNAARRAANYLSFAITSSATALRRLPRNDVSLVYSSPITAAAPALALRAMRRTPYVLLVQDMWPQSVSTSGFLSDNPTRWTERALHWYCDAVYRRAAAIAVTSPGMVELIAKRGVIDPRRIEFVANWADEENYYQVTPTAGHKRNLGLEDKFTVMYAGNFGEAQSLQTLIQAATILRNATDIQFVLIGNGVAERALRDLTARHGLPNVTFLASRSPGDMAAVLAAGDLQIVCLKDRPLFERTLPSKVQSLLAAGRPIVGAVGGDAAKIIEDSGGGVAVPPESADRLAAEIASLRAAGRDRLMKMGERGAAYYRANLSAEVGSNRLTALLKVATMNVLEQHHRPARPGDYETCKKP